MPLPLIALAGGALLAALTVAASSSSSSSSSSSRSSRSSRSSQRTEVDHQALEEQRQKEQQQRKYRTQQDIANDLSKALRTLGANEKLSVSRICRLAEPMLRKPAPRGPGAELLQRLNEFNLGTKAQRQLLGHLLVTGKDSLSGLPVLQKELAQLSNTAQRCSQLEQLKEQLAQVV